MEFGDLLGEAALDVFDAEATGGGVGGGDDVEDAIVGGEVRPEVKLLVCRQVLMKSGLKSVMSGRGVEVGVSVPELEVRREAWLCGCEGSSSDSLWIW